MQFIQEMLTLIIQSVAITALLVTAFAGFTLLAQFVIGVFAIILTDTKPFLPR